MEGFNQTYLDIAQQLNVTGWNDKNADVKKLVQLHLSKESAGRWLLVFDNADDIDMWITKLGSEPGSNRLIDYLPRSTQGCIIFTTRDRKTAVKLAHQNVIEVPEMDEDMAIQLLEKRLVNPDLIVKNKPDTKALLKELTYLPLAIVQAAAYINENRIEFADYLSLLADQEEDVIALLGEEFEDDGRYRNVKNPVATTWLISFEQIRQRDALAADYLSFMCCIDSKDIPQSILPPAPSRKREIEAIGTLDAYSFISKRPVDLAFDLHRLVHLSMRNWLRKEQLLAHVTEEVIERLEEVFPDEDHKNRTVWRTYLPHVRYVLESNLVDKDWQSRIYLITRYGNCLYEDGRWSEAEAAFAEVLEINRRDIGADHPHTLISMASLAATYWNQGRLDEAEELDVEVMKTRRTKLGADHPDTLSSMANLAATYRNQGRLDEAEELEVQVIETRRTKLGANHPDTLSCMANLAVTYRNQGRLDEAEELDVQVIEKSRTKLGADHPDTLSSMANLAATYRNQGRLDEAEELGVQVMEKCRTKLGADHLDTLSSMANLAATYWNQGRLDEAEQLEVQVIETSRTKLGADHPDTLSSMANLAATYWNQGRATEALKLMEECVVARTRKLGTNHPDTLSSRIRLLGWQTGESEIGGSVGKDLSGIMT